MGARGSIVTSLPHDQLQDVLRKYNRLRARRSEWLRRDFRPMWMRVVDRLAPMSISAQAAPDEIRLAMASVNELFNTEVFGNRNFDALDDIYTADARILPPGAPMISGRPAIKEFLVQSDPVGGCEMRQVLASIEVIPAGGRPCRAWGVRP